VDHKNSWQLAEHPGQDKPLGLQRLLSRASWDADVLRDKLIRYAGEHLGVHNAVLSVDETGFLKKGTKSVARRRSIELCFESAKQRAGLDEYEVRS
jgi:SRSO17 transposase